MVTEVMTVIKLILALNTLKLSEDYLNSTTINEIDLQIHEKLCWAALKHITTKRHKHTKVKLIELGRPHW